MISALAPDGSAYVQRFCFWILTSTVEYMIFVTLYEDGIWNVNSTGERLLIKVWMLKTDDIMLLGKMLVSWRTQNCSDQEDFTKGGVS